MQRTVMSDFYLHCAENKDPLNTGGIEDGNQNTWLQTDDFSNVIPYDFMLPESDSNLHMGHVPGYGNTISLELLLEPQD